MKRPPALIVAALVAARQGDGRVPTYGKHGKGARQAIRAGFMEEVGCDAELNMRGQDVADEAIAKRGQK